MRSLRRFWNSTSTTSREMTGSPRPTSTEGSHTPRNLHVPDPSKGSAPAPNLGRTSVGPSPDTGAGATSVLLREGLLLSIFVTVVLLTSNRVGDGTLDVTTGLLLLTSVCAFAFLASEVSMRIFTRSHNARNRVRLLLVTFGLLLFGAEFFLRYGLGIHATYPERNGHPTYVSLFGQPNTTWFHTFEAHVTVTDDKAEFFHFRQANSLGLPEREIPVDKTSGEYRIIVLGDSFTEGVGTVYDSSWVRAMERNLNAEFPEATITAFNAGVSGSDVFYEYMLLKERLLTLDPDLVIVAINDSDVNEIMIRGGMERFLPDGSTVYSRTAPRWEWLYGASFIVRHIVHDLLGYDWLFLKGKEIAEAQSQAVAQIAIAVERFADLAQEREFPLLIMTHPHSSEIDAGHYLQSFDGFLDDQDRIAWIDLLDHYITTGIITGDNASQFYWPIDAHHNARGYQAMGDAIAGAVKRLSFISD